MHSVVTAVFFRKVPSNVSAILGKLSTGKGAVVEAGVVEVVAMLVEVFVLLLWKQNYNLITGTKLASSQNTLIGQIFFSERYEKVP